MALARGGPSLLSPHLRRQTWVTAVRPAKASKAGETSLPASNNDAGADSLLIRTCSEVLKVAMPLSTISSTISCIYTLLTLRKEKAFGRVTTGIARDPSRRLPLKLTTRNFRVAVQVSVPFHDARWIVSCSCAETAQMRRQPGMSNVLNQEPPQGTSGPHLRPPLPTCYVPDSCTSYLLPCSFRGAGQGESGADLAYSVS